jgi:hypothetical protein
LSKAARLGAALVELSRCAAGLGCVAANRKQDSVHVGRQATIGRPGVHHIGPEFFVREAMRANHGHMAKFLAEFFHLGQGEHFKIDYRYLGTSFQDCLPKLGFLGEGYSTALAAQIIGQGVGRSRVVLSEYNVQGQHHRTPFAQIVNAKGRGFGPQQDGSFVYFVAISNGSAWSFPFCFKSISTLPSASSNSLRQLFES